MVAKQWLQEWQMCMPYTILSAYGIVQCSNPVMSNWKDDPEMILFGNGIKH